MSTIKDIARQAGVSISTVSYALNNIPKVNKETRDRILAIARELDYHPNTMARNLKMGSSHRIGVFLHEITGAYYTDIMKGIQETLVPYDFDLLAASVTTNNRERAYSLLREKWMDGAILVNSANIEPELLNSVSGVLPLVLMDREPDTAVLDNRNICTMIVDNYQGAAEMTAHLLRLGRKKIVYMAGDRYSYDNKKRFEGFTDTLRAHGLQLDSRWYLEGDFHNSVAYTRMRLFLEGGNRPDAVFCANDEMALGVMHALGEFGLKVPTDVSVSGFDNIEFSQYSNPPLTTVSFDRLGMGRTAVHALMDMLRRNSTGRAITIPTTLVLRSSCSV